MIQYRVVDATEAPIPRKGPKYKWDLPLKELRIEKAIVLHMSLTEARQKAKALRGYVTRQQKLLNMLFSVFVTEDGLVILRRELKDMKESQ